MAKKTTGSAKRFGARYGRTNREKVSKIEALKRNSTKCPYCNKEGVSRVSVGIWACSKCGSKFTGQAYTQSKRTVRVVPRVTEEIQAFEAPVTEEPELETEMDQEETLDEE